MVSSKREKSKRMETEMAWRRIELVVLLLYAGLFYLTVIRTSLELPEGIRVGSLRGLRPGWISGQLNDVSDSQWRNFRGNLPALALVMSIFMVINKTARSLLQLSGEGMTHLWLALSAVYVIYLHGACTLFIICIAGGSYIITKTLAGSSFLPGILWAYNIFFLINNRVYDGYSFSAFGESLRFLDENRGSLRWHIGFNFVVLRMLSFGMDYHWAFISQNQTSNFEKHNQNCEVCQSGGLCYLIRQVKPLPLTTYSFGRYLCYLLYPPLFIAGPIISFNAFASQIEMPQRTYNRFQTLVYGIRWIFCFGLMELITHFCYFNSFAISGVWKTLSPWQTFVVGYGVLIFMWLKFLIIWRFFRFWALVGGIEAIENMPRCVHNSYDLEGFWKNWHSSYNRWLVRYLYIPLGGARWRLLNVWIVFTFVALWHDLEWKLLSWAWVTCLLMIPEVSAKLLMRSSKMEEFRKLFIYRELCALGGALNIGGLMVVNLIGFVVGLEGMKQLGRKMLEKENISLVIAILVTFYVGAKLVFHIRDMEALRRTKTQAD